LLAGWPHDGHSGGFDDTSSVLLLAAAEVKKQRIR